jgi:serine protease
MATPRRIRRPRPAVLVLIAAAIVAMLAAACLPAAPAPAPTVTASAPTTTTTQPPPLNICGVTASAASADTGAAASDTTGSTGSTDQYVAVVRQGSETKVLTRHIHSAAEAAKFHADATSQGEVLAFAQDAEVHALDQTATWGFTDSNFTAAWVEPTATNGTPTRVAIIDTGADTGIDNTIDPVRAEHPDLSGQWDTLHTADFVRASDVNNPPSVIGDFDGHGTHVAGILAALDDGQGVVGGAPGATLVPVRVLDASGSGFFSDVAAGILWAASTTKGDAAVISMSLGGGSDPGSVVGAAITAVEDPTNSSYTHPVIVAAAGNSHCSSPIYPAAYSATHPQVLAVSALCKPGTTIDCPAQTPFPSDAYQLATFSSLPWSGVGTPTGIAAPGVQINSTWPSSGYAVLSGTSMATPFVSAAAALVVAHCPSDTAAEVVARLETSAHDLGRSGPDKLYGYGMLDANAAVQGC